MQPCCQQLRAFLVRSDREHDGASSDHTPTLLTFLLAAALRYWPQSAAPRAPNVVNNHVANAFAAVLLRQQVLRQSSCGNFGKVLVLDNCEHLLLGQAAESDAIFERDHVTIYCCST